MISISLRLEIYPVVLIGLLPTNYLRDITSGPDKLYGMATGILIIRNINDQSNYQYRINDQMHCVKYTIKQINRSNALCEKYMINR